MLLLALAVAGLAAYSEFKFRERSASLDVELATYKRQRWDRPVLRGRPGEGNAALEALQALQGFTGLSAEEREGLAAQLFHGQKLMRDQDALVAKHAAMTAKLRQATQLGWSMTELSPERRNAAAPPYPLLIDAVLLALGDAKRGTSDDCLTACADLARLGQDLVPGASLEATSVSMRITSLAAPVVSSCVADASLEALSRAAREFGALALQPPPIGSGIELADLRASAELRRLAELLPPGGEELPWTRLRKRPSLLGAFVYFEKPSRWRELSAKSYPLALDTWHREQEWRAQSEIPLVAESTAGVDGWLYDDMRGQALLRSLTLGLSTVAARARTKRLPHEPVGLNDPGLRDPFNGQALKWLVPEAGVELSIWSVGEDRRDDKGLTEWTAAAPIDVVVRFPLRPLTTAPVKAPR
jgi:hypothetical protein